MRVLIVTKIYPNSVEPFSSPFNRQQFAALGRLCDIEILATIPWFPGIGAFRRWSAAARLVPVPAREWIDGRRVQHPRFVYVPKVARGLAGPLYAASLAPLVSHYRQCVDVVLGSWAYPDGFAAVVLAGLLSAPAVIKLHGSDMNVIARMPGPRRRLRWAIPRSQRVVAVSRPLAESAARFGLQKDRIDVVHNGVDLERFKPQDQAAARAHVGLDPASRIILYVGRLEVEKGVMDLIEAVAAMRSADAQLVMVGDGATKKQCERLARRRGVRLRLAGTRPHAEIADWIAASDVVALPSHAEGMPNVVLEALACGRRVVASHVGGIPDVVSSEALGQLVAPRAPAELERALSRVLSDARTPPLDAASARLWGWDESAARLRDSLAMAVDSARA
jgi:glycosyltransferase involved in cell wall biosynthesis